MQRILWRLGRGPQEEEEEETVRGGTRSGGLIQDISRVVIQDEKKTQNGIRQGMRGTPQGWEGIELGTFEGS